MVSVTDRDRAEAEKYLQDLRDASFLKGEPLALLIARVREEGRQEERKQWERRILSLYWPEVRAGIRWLKQRFHRH